jgi:acetylornithine/N-succinyldiaminopimelate aminotransferase
LKTFDRSEGKCLFLSSGSEAVELGVRVARLLTKKPLLLTLSDSYLAAYGSAGQKRSEEWYCFDWSVCRSCPQSDTCDPQCSHLKEIPFGRIGGLIFEPGCTGGLVKFPPRRLIENLAQLVKQQEGLIVVDEVTTGMGRTGTWYGYEHYSLQPDIVALGKGLGNGYPVSVVVMSPMVAEELETMEFHYAQSHQNDPLACAVAREVIRVIREEGLVERSKKVGSYFLKELCDLVEKYDVMKEARGRGLLLGLEFHDDRDSFSLQRMFLRLFEAGFIVGYKPIACLLRFLPPLTIQEKDIALLLDTCHDAITPY